MTPAQKKSRENFKKAVAEAKKLRAKNPKLSQAQAVKQAWAILYSTGKVGKAKTKKAAKKKAATKKATSTHKDTKSHNVNIRVVSGVSKAKKLQKDLKSKGLKLTHGYNLAARKIGAVNDEYKNIMTYENEIAKIKNFIKNNPGLTQKVKNEYAKGINYYKRLITSAKYNISLHKK